MAKTNTTQLNSTLIFPRHREYWAGSEGQP